MENKKLRWILSFILSAAIVVFVFYQVSSSNAYKVFMNGDLSFKHSLLKNDCQECHEPWGGVNNKSCLNCHENKEHFIKKESKAKHVSQKEFSCVSCHVEHQGEYHNLKLVEINSCKSCHEWKNHPEMKGLDIKKPGNGKILFGHPVHYEMGTYEEGACDMCHITPVKGNTFGLATFDDLCVMCHALGKHSTDAEDLTMCPICHLNNNFDLTYPIDRFKVNSIYSHENHQEFKCEECHSDVVINAETTDLGMPEISKCMNCHESNRINEHCVTCHNFHGY